jgi:GAF domain-containing protein
MQSLTALVAGETDPISVMSTISCELYHAFAHFHWVGFYRLVDDKTLKVGPYQGTHGCLTIDLARGVCGKCARENRIQIENDVSKVPHHLACSGETRAEIVLPVLDPAGNLRAVLDIDATEIDSFDETDEKYLTIICAYVYEGSAFRAKEPDAAARGRRRG